ncbi:MAG: hypothetical protein RJA70_2430 [Pseudomonadota bacterium]|jgi:predicted ATPase
MLLQFRIKNHRSFRELAELSFVSTNRKDEPAFRIECAHTEHGVLPVVGIWGANASGKSNLIHALHFFRSAVQNSHARWEPTRPVSWWPWGLVTTGPDAHPTTMEIDLVVESVRFTYGFEIYQGEFVREHLFRWERARRQVLFTRDVAAKESPWHFGPSLKGQRARIAEATRSNSLYLAAAAQENHPLLTSVYEAIVRGVHFERPYDLRGFPLFQPNAHILEESFRQSLLELLRAADVGISGIRVETHDPSPALDAAVSMFRPEFAEEVRKKMPNEDGRFLLFVHGDVDGWELPPEDESRGTQILLARLSDIVATLKTGGLLVLDEIDSSLHPDLCVALVKLFTSAETNPRGAQLLFTTHDRDLLTTLRTDEVLLVDKNRNGVSSLAAASDYREVRSRENLRDVHEQGRIRGVPVLGDFAQALNQREA